MSLKIVLALKYLEEFKKDFDEGQLSYYNLENAIKKLKEILKDTKEITKESLCGSIVGVCHLCGSGCRSIGRHKWVDRYLTHFDVYECEECEAIQLFEARS